MVRVSEPGLSTRRSVLAAGLLVAVRPAWPLGDDLQAAIRTYTGGALVRSGRVTLDVPQLVDNGNTVPLTVKVDSPMTTDDHVRAIALFNERNPYRDIARFTLGPRSGIARVSTRMRLAASQQLVAVATLSDGSFWSHSVDVVVTLAACIE